MDNFKAILFIPLLPFIIIALIGGCIYGVMEMGFLDAKEWIAG